MPDVTMPRLSDSMEEGTILTWLVEDGAEVRAGQELAEVETDKATMTFEAEVDGVFETLVAAGETVALGVPIARIAAPGEAREAAAPPKPAPAPAVLDAPVVDGGAPSRNGSGADGDGADRGDGRPKRAFASPLARRVAASLGVELGAIAGTGPRGRITRDDVERAHAATGESPASAPTASVAVAEPTTAPAASEASEAPAATPAAAAATEVAPAAGDGVGAKGTVTTVALSRLQQVVARRMAESKATVPDFAVAVDVDMEAASALREQLRDAADGSPPSFNDLVVMACGRALREQPNANGAYRDGGIEHFSRVNVGVAVAAPDALVVPTVFDADRRSLGEISRTIRLLAGRVRDGSITPPELAGATFTVSNLGGFGVDRFTAVVNAPQAAILAVGAVTPRAVVREGELVARRTMTITLSADHRVLYGADAAAFVARVRELLETPLGLVAG